MSKTALFILCMLAGNLYASDGENQIELQDLESIVVEESFSPPAYRPGSTHDLAHAFGQACFGKPCKPDKFLIEPCKQLLKELKKTDHQKFQLYANAIHEFNTSASKTRHRGVAIKPQPLLPQEFIMLACEAWKKDHETKQGTIDGQSTTLSQNNQTIQGLEQYGTYKTRGLVGTVAVILLQTAGYFIYTYATSC